ncbi:hypothetical protein Bbelb_323140 [Branchiostoma belcheri]|nr:hypothetical protein Bbelb_323140 [Branchiostoma belcheri]
MDEFVQIQSSLHITKTQVTKARRVSFFRNINRSSSLGPHPQCIVPRNPSAHNALGRGLRVDLSGTWPKRSKPQRQTTLWLLISNVEEVLLYKAYLRKCTIRTG